MYKPEILFLKQEDVVKAGLLNMKLVLEATEDVFRLIGEGKVINPAKVFLGVPSTEDWTSYGMSMPSYIGGDNDVIGFKWAAESKFNSTQPGMPYGIDVVLLSNPKTMYPKAIMDGTITTAMRTSAVAGVCAKYTARKNSRIACLVGAGVIGRTMIMSIGDTISSLKEIRIVDLNASKAEGLAKEFEGKYNVVAYGNTEEAVKGADLVVTETTSQKTFIKKEWLKNDATVIQMEMMSFEEDVLLSADRVILDNWEQMSHLKGVMVNKLYEEGKMKREDVSLIEEMVTGQIKGRENDKEFIYCGTAGVGAVDIAIANMLYENAKKMGIGQKLVLWDDPLWV
jgi:ornithine cyclodeaminase